MFIGRRADGSIYGAWSSRQAEDADHPNIEELPDDHPEVVAFLAERVPTPAELIDRAFPQSGVARVLFFALLELANDVRELRARVNGLAPGSFTAGQVAQVTPAQLKAWLESKLP